VLIDATAVVVLLIVATLVGGADVARAQDPAVEDSTPPVVDPRVLPVLAAVPVDSPDYRAAIASYREAQDRLDAARATYADAEADVVTLNATEARLVGEQNQAVRERTKAQARSDQLRIGVQQFAVAAYIDGGIGDLPPPDLDLDATNEQLRRRALIDAASEQQFAELVANTDAVRRMDEVLVQVSADLEDVRGRTQESEATRDAAIAAGNRASADLAVRGPKVSDARLGATVVGLDFTFVVLDAYVKAATTLAVEKPDCGLRWAALAGIGRTESGHGTYGGSVVQPDGDLSQPIVGIPLDGANGTAVIGDSEGGAVDGDPEFDRAVGPMQFIPTSWRTLGRDGNGDGRADPQNMYDAALAAAGLLCRTKGLDTDAGMRAAFLGYNNSSAYADLVLERTRGYDRFVIPPPPP
jgi:membrane-bound lytic murein transglycosylase B